MTTTSTDHFEVFGDATFVAATDSFGPADFVAATEHHDDPLAVRDRDRDLLSATALSAIEVPPSDLPAAQLPDYEPTAEDLSAMKDWIDEDRIDELIAAANTESAVKARRLDLIRLRAELPAAALADEPDATDLERAA